MGTPRAGSCARLAEAVPASHIVSIEARRTQPSHLTVCLLVVHILVRVIDIGAPPDTMHNVSLLLLLPHLALIVIRL